MIKDKTFQILFLLAIVLLGIACISAANLNLRINGFVNGYSSDVKLKTNPFASSGYDPYDFIVLFNPSNLQLGYKITSAQTGTIIFSWNSLSGTGYKGVFTYYGTDGDFLTPVEAENMTTSASYNNTLTGNSQVYAGVTIEDVYPKFGTMNTSIFACEGDYLSYLFNISDEGGAAPSISVSPQNPFYTRFNSYVDAITNKYELYSGILNKSDAGGVNKGYKKYNETITANNGKNSNSTTINITVIEINNAPVIEAIPDYDITIGDAFYKKVSADDTENGDQDSGNLTFNVSFSGAVLFNISSNGTMALLTNSAQEGIHNITVCATDKGILNPYSGISSRCGQDGSNKTACKSFILNITSVYVEIPAGVSPGGGGSGANSKPANKTGKENNITMQNSSLELNIEKNETPESNRLSCGEWSKCSAVYGLSDIISGSVFLKGEQKRICIDARTREQRIEKQACDAKETVVAKESSNCFKNYIEIFNQDEQMVSRLEMTENGKLNIQMIVDKPAYCPYCYDGIKDYDEEGVDCGGNCGTCYEKVYSIAGMERIIFFIIFVMIVSFVNLAIFLIYRNYKMKHELSKVSLEKRKV